MAFFDFLLSKEKRETKQAERAQAQMQQAAGNMLAMQTGMLSTLPGGLVGMAAQQAALTGNQVTLNDAAAMSQGTAQGSFWSNVTKGFRRTSAPLLYDMGPAAQFNPAQMPTGVLGPILPQPTAGAAGVTVPGPPAGLVVASAVGGLTLLGVVGFLVFRMASGNRRRR